MVDLSSKTFNLFLLFSFFSTICLSQTEITKGTVLNSFEIRSDSKGLFISEKTKDGRYEININGADTIINFSDGKGYLDTNPSHEGKLFFLTGPSDNMKLIHLAKRQNGQLRIQNIPLRLSLILPLIAIILALIFKEVVISLFLGIWAGAFIIGGLRIESLYYFLISFLEVVQKFIIKALTDGGHISVIVFSILIGGMVAIISKNGGMAGVVKSLSKYSKDQKSSQFITWLLGVAIFFDDYANTLIVGNTMRSVTDKFRISREKLAYIVDSTAAPVSAIAFITTWIGAELGYINDGMSKIALETDATAYSIFLSSLKYSYYPIFTLGFILILIFTQKDYGPMYSAEKRARSTGKVSGTSSQSEEQAELEDLSPVKGSPLMWQYAFFPVITVILMTILGLMDTGFHDIYLKIHPDGTGSSTYGAIWNDMNVLFTNQPSFLTKVGKIIGSADSYSALLWASLSGVLVAILITVLGRVMKLSETINWMVVGFKTMLPALIILTLAWALAITTDELHTAEFLGKLLTGNVSPYLLSAIVFILAAFIAFSTGSSWSTMAILYPIVIPTTYAVCAAAGLSSEISMEILLSVIATVLAASVLGDHCSPISDTTILSSLASECNHIDHVKTQLPYAMTVGGVSLISVFFATLFTNPWINLLLFGLGFIVLYIIVNRLGKNANI